MLHLPSALRGGGGVFLRAEEIFLRSVNFMVFGVCESKLDTFCNIFTKSANAEKVLVVAVFGTLSMYRLSSI